MPGELSIYSVRCSSRECRNVTFAVAHVDDLVVIFEGSDQAADEALRSLGCCVDGD